MDPGNYDNIKRILAGDHCKVAVKFKENQVVMRTPINVCSNNNIFPRNDQFYNRMYTYGWYKYPYWRHTELNMKFHPVALGLLMCWAADIDSLNYNTLRKQFIRNIYVLWVNK